MLELTNPVQTVLVTSRHRVISKFSGLEDDKDDIITLDWHTTVSFKPMKYAIVVGKSHFSYQLIKESGVFIVNFISYKLRDAAMFCGKHSGEHIDKFKESGLTKEQGEWVDCPRIKEASAFLECELLQEIDVGENAIFIGNVVGRVTKTDEKRLFHHVGDKYTTTME